MDEKTSKFVWLMTKLSALEEEYEDLEDKSISLQAKLGNVGFDTEERRRLVVKKKRLDVMISEISDEYDVLFNTLMAENDVSLEEFAKEMYDVRGYGSLENFFGLDFNLFDDRDDIQKFKGKLTKTELIEKIKSTRKYKMGEIKVSVEDNDYIIPVYFTLDLDMVANKNKKLSDFIEPVYKSKRVKIENNIEKVEYTTYKLSEELHDVDVNLLKISYNINNNGYFDDVGDAFLNLMDDKFKRIKNEDQIMYFLPKKWSKYNKNLSQTSNNEGEVIKFVAKNANENNPM